MERTVDHVVDVDVVGKGWNRRRGRVGFFKAIRNVVAVFRETDACIEVSCVVGLRIRVQFFEGVRARGEWIDTRR
jgi:hypothetical protein